MTSRPYHLDPTPARCRVALVYKDFANLKGRRHVGLGVSAAATAAALSRMGVWAEVWPTSVNDIRARIERAEARAELPPTHVVISAPWIATEDLVDLAVAYPNIVFDVVSHSNVAFLAADRDGVRLLREAASASFYHRNLRVGGVCRRFTDWASLVWKTDVAWLPNLFDLTTTPAPRRPAWPGDQLRIGLFGAGRILKNGLTAAAAAMELAVTLRVPTELHVSQEPGDSQQNDVIEQLVAGAPNFTLVRQAWRPWPEFRQLVHHMHLLLQPSFTESFNVVSADGVTEGVPTVVSDAIDWLPDRWQARADDPHDVAKVANALLHDPNAVEDGRRALASYVRDGLRSWSDFLEVS